MEAKTPFVSALTIGGHDAFVTEMLLPVSIACFLHQTWPPEHRELIVVQDHLLPDWLLEQCKAAGNIRVVPHPGFARSVGAMRNESLDAARGDCLISWDADDHHHPTRMHAQVLACQQFPGKASFLQRAICYSFPTDTAFIRDFHACPIHGTICHPRNDSIRYPDLGKGEDTEYLKAWGRDGYVAIQSDPAMYVRLHTGHNTWDDAHILRGFTDVWAAGQWHLCDVHRQYLREVVLPSYHQIVEARNANTTKIANKCPPCSSNSG